MAKISSGSYDLNKFLFGGYEKDIITVIYGDSGTGKTALCLIAAVSQAKKGNKVIFIDTEGGFSTERIKQLAPEDHEKILKNIFLLKPTSFQEQKQAFQEILKNLKDQISLIIIDGMTMLYRLDFADARQKGEKNIQEINSELAKQARILAEIARKQNIPVLVTNQVYNYEDETKMVGGDILRYWGKCHLQLKNDKGKRTAILQKHRSLPEKSLHFQINNEGIKKRGWL